jgi:hypothetical protein
MANGSQMTAIHGNGDGGEVIVRPQQTVGIAAEQARVQAEIQSQLMVARTCPRDEVDALDRIKTACQRIGLAENSEYSYSRGGTEINGPTIDLLRVIANCWGNISYGFRELSQANGESTIESYAWELETNAKNTKVFTVPHKRYTKSGSYALTDPRDIYETVANNAERRVRACLEAIIPPDVVGEAVEECRATMRAKADVTPDAIKKLRDAYAKISVTTEQLEARLGRRLDSMQPAQLVSLRRIWKSIDDGMSKPADWFPVAEAEEQPKSAADAAKDALRKRQPAEPPEDTTRPQTADDVDAGLVERFRGTMAECKDTESIEAAVQAMSAFGDEINEATWKAIDGAVAARKAELSPVPKGKGKQGSLVQ